jgi:hypothetical protein
MKRYLYNIVIREENINKYCDKIDSIVDYLNSNILFNYREKYKLKNISRDVVVNMIRRPNKNPKKWEKGIIILRVSVKKPNTHAEVEKSIWSEEDQEIEELEQYLQVSQEDIIDLKREIFLKKYYLLEKKGIKAEDCILQAEGLAT